MKKLLRKSQISKHGFTLAEVLITLVIIGVIAAVTIPTVINNTKKQEYVSKLKKTYSVLAQATNKIIAEEGNVENWTTSSDNVYSLYKKQMSVTKDCGAATGCFEQASNLKSATGELANYSPWNSTDGRRFIISDGTLVRITNELSPNCDVDDTNRSGYVCALIMVDINGGKKPNQFGRDIFWFALKKDGLHPRGCEGNSAHCLNWGDDCSCKVLKEGAMNY